MKTGASMLSWIHPAWDDHAVLYAIRKTAETGFDLIELLLPHTMKIDVYAIRHQLKDCRLDAVCGLNLSVNTHIPTHPKEATKLIKKAIDLTSALELTQLGGVLHSGIGAFSGKCCTDAEKNIICDVWNDIAIYAAGRGITIGVEPVNRYESYVCNTGNNVLELFQKVNAANMFLHLDTFHMNIEEDNFYDPVIQAGKCLKQIHATESNRGMLGEGNVRWDDLARALKEIHFDGNIVLENFSSHVEGMSNAVSLWQPSKYNAEDLAKGSLAFVRRMFV